jgi:hypothetical protein
MARVIKNNPSLVPFARCSPKAALEKLYQLKKPV